MNIKNNVTNFDLLDWETLKTFKPNNLKDKNRDITKLKNNILENGFNFPFYIWESEKYFLDGDGRTLALLQLEKEGYKIPKLPVVYIKANNLKDFKKKVLAVNSQHGKITQSSITEFTSLDFEIEEMKELANSELNLGELDFMIENIDEIKTDSLMGCKKLSKEELRFWNKRSNSDRNMAETKARLGEKYTRFTTQYARNNEPLGTITAGDNNILFSEPRKLNNTEYCLAGSFPLDYNFLDIEPRYLIGMSVPPIMTAQIAYQVYLQLFKNNLCKN